MSLGYKSNGSLDYVKMNHGQTLDFVAIDQGLNRIAVQNLTLTVTQQEYVSVLTRQDDGTYAYESVEKDQVISTAPVTIPAEGWKWKLPSANPGTYRAELRNADGDRVSALWFTVVGEGDTARPLDRNAELKIKLDHDSYNGGDDIAVSIVAPYTGSGLITIERDKVYAAQWFTTDKTSTVQHIRLPEGLDGTGYVNVSFIRALDSREIFMSPLSYGVVPFQANRDRRKVHVTLDTAKLSKPGDPLKITYKTDRPGRIVVFAVDEGILQVTGYTTPDPLEYFFEKQALSVTTSQIVDLILPEFSILRSAATGGDGEARQLNPFRRVTDKPVVYWSGILDSGTDERDVTYDVPDYFSGNLKVMAVAISPDAVGSAETNSLIRGPFVLTPGVPTFVAPGDQFEVGVTVANNVAGSGTNAPINVFADVSEQLEIVQAPPAVVPISEGREEAVTFKFRAKDKLGSASITFHAASRRAGVPPAVHAECAPSCRADDGRARRELRDRSVDLAVTRQFRPEYRDLQAVLSALPLGLAHGLDSYLQNYPNGCSEQISSGGPLPAAVSPMRRTSASSGRKWPPKWTIPLRSCAIARMTRGRLVTGVRRIARRSISSPSYVMHFLIEARDAGFDPPPDMFQLGLRNLAADGHGDPVQSGGGADGRLRDLSPDSRGSHHHQLYPEPAGLPGQDRKGAWKTILPASISPALLLDAPEGRRSGRTHPRLSHRRPYRQSSSWCDFYSGLGMDAQYVAIVSRYFPGDAGHASRHRIFTGSPIPSRRANSTPSPPPMPSWR